MRICVTRCARQPREVEGRGHSRCRTLVAVATGNSSVSACEPERQLLVHRQAERRWLESLYCVTTLALAEVRCVRELLVVIVLVAIRASGKS